MSLWTNTAYTTHNIGNNTMTTSPKTTSRQLSPFSTHFTHHFSTFQNIQIINLRLT